MKPITFGNITVNANCLLAPLAGVSDLPYRRLNRRFGCRYAFTEMVSARAVLARSKIDMKMLLTEPQDRPLGVQLVGKDAEVLRRALDIIREYRFDSIDFNAACPVKKVTRRGEGACLMKEPRKLRELLKVLVVESGVPVTVKIRAGWDRRSINAREAALYARDAGVAAVFIHGRTRSQLYKETVDYGVIRQVKEALDIPVIGSGDVFSPVLA
ncbi:MAG: tRNA-dihydrouridine synthase family protein, partial [Deltaproteobacteria bacterium]|nr:tRNA-dihydrouridine synthase family protein [Deltaproteobacteria bacterium]